MYLFILESIGTSEIIIIGLVALIFLGPRKIPELARTLGKAMNEFRRSTNEFKQTWEREVVTEVNKFNTEVQANTPLDEPLAIETTRKDTITVPEIKQVSEADFKGIISKENLETIAKENLETVENGEAVVASGKQSWL